MTAETPVQQPQQQQVPSIGRIVHFTLPDGPNAGACRPAVIVRVWAWPEQVTPDTAVQLQVFTDGPNDGLEPVAWRTSIVQGDKPGQWHWPEYVPPQIAMEAVGQVTAKFRVGSVQKANWGTQIRLDVDDADGRNKEWAAATPSGEIFMTVKHQMAAEVFTLGRAFTVTFTPES